MTISSLPTHGRRSFLTGAGVLALAPLAAEILAAQPADASPTGGPFDFDLPLNRIGTSSIRWDMAMRSRGMPKIVAGMGAADMDFRCAPAITEALQKRISFPNWGYEMLDADLILANPRGMSFVKTILDWNQRRHGLSSISPEMVGFTPGVMPGIVSALQTCVPKGSKVLMLTPAYVGFYLALSFAGMVPEESPMKLVDDRYEIDWDDLEKRMASDVKISILCNPHNPTGRVWTREELVRYAELCKKHGIIILADEIHCDFTKDRAYVPFSSLGKDLIDNSITFKSGSKSFSLPAMKCGWFFTTNPALYQKIYKASFPAISNLALVAQHAAYADGEEWLDACVDYINANLDYAHDYIRREMPLVKSYRPEGTYLMWLDVSRLADRIDARARPARPLSPAHSGPALATRADIVSDWFAREAYVALESGSGFGAGGADYARMNVATSRVTLAAALNSMAAALRKLS